MQHIRVVFEEEVDLPRRLVDLWRTERSDNNCSESDCCEHGYDGNRWSWMRSGGRPGWAYDWSEHHPSSWGYVFDFDDDTRGICRVREVNPALRALGCRVDLLLEPAAPPPRVDPHVEWTRLLEDAIRRQQTSRPVADSLPTYRLDDNSYTITYDTSHWSNRSTASPGPIRWTGLNDEGYPRYLEEDERF
jgi:hypothetical protein